MLSNGGSSMVIVNSVILWVIISISINTYLMTLPTPALRKRDFLPTYVIQQNNRIDFQKDTECAAYSTAYMLRHFGMDAEGESLYKYFPNKTRAGNVYPKGVRTVLRKKGFKKNSEDISKKIWGKLFTGARLIR